MKSRFYGVAFVIIFIMCIVVAYPALAETGTPVVKQIDLTPFLQALIALLAALITTKVIPWIKANTTTKQNQIISATVQTLVFAAEQIYGAGHGEDKLDYVIKQLAERGFKVDRAEIEAAVGQMNISYSSVPVFTELVDSEIVDE